MNRASYSEITEAIRKLPQRVALVAVTKSVGVEETNGVIKAGVSAIGENRVEDFEKKLPKLLPVEKHFIGRIQSRKLKSIVELFDVIQSVGSIEHLEKIEKEALAQHKQVKVLLQFNISGEKQKGGFGMDDVENVAATIQHSLLSNSCELDNKDNTSPPANHVPIIGVMGMAEDTKDSEVARKQFRLLKDIRNQLRARLPQVTELSMGMSNDYKIALEEGATMLRIGRALFGGTI